MARRKPIEPRQVLQYMTCMAVSCETTISAEGKARVLVTQDEQVSLSLQCFSAQLTHCVYSYAKLM